MLFYRALNNKTSMHNNSILNDSIVSQRRSPGKENSIKITASKGKDYSFSINDISNTLRPNNVTDSEKRSFKIDLTKMRKQWDKKKTTKYIKFPEKKTLNTVVQSNFETFNNTPQNKNVANNIKITKEEHQLIKNDSESDTDGFEHIYSAKHNLSKRSDYQVNLEFNKQKITDKRINIISKNRLYINEFGEESMLSESSWEEVPAKQLNRSQFQNTVQARKLMVDNAYNPQIKDQGLFKRQVTKNNTREISMKKRSKENLNPKHIHSAEMRISKNTNDSIESMFVPKIKLNNLNCKLNSLIIYSTSKLLNGEFL